MTRPTHILFIGNSFTQRNDLPGMLARLASAAHPPRRIETRRVIANGMSLKTHWNRGAARDAIAQGPLDYVVLQEQSTLPLKNRARMHESVRLFNDEIVARGARTVLYLTWARSYAADRQDELSEAYQSIGREIGAIVVPVGVAWQAALRQDPDLVLHDKDGSHPNPLGTYLAACTFYATLFRQSPEGLTANVPGVEGESADRVRMLRQVAWQAAQS